MNTDPNEREVARSAMARILELVALPGFELLPPIEQDYLIDLVVCEANGKTIPHRPPWKWESVS
ncbi:MAG: hypothetical protein HY554_18840 [Elusimicrobia bacterium]|nr:hypothetical protein [Elusimicrobiota bacterium]